MSRPFVQLLKPRADDAAIKQSAEPGLVTEVRWQAVAEGVLVGKHARQLEEDPRHSRPGIAEERGERLEPAQRDAGSGDEGVGVQHPAGDNVHEEALGDVLRLGQVAVLEVGGDHACQGAVGTSQIALTGIARRRGPKERVCCPVYMTRPTMKSSPSR